MTDPTPPIERLRAIMARLRDPVAGCEWDKVQTFATIAPYTIEEAYEVADACQRGDLADLKDELGDLLLQVIFHSRLAEAAGAFASDAVPAAAGAAVWPAARTSSATCCSRGSSTAAWPRKPAPSTSTTSPPPSRTRWS